MVYNNSANFFSRLENLNPDSGDMIIDIVIISPSFSGLENLNPGRGDMIIDIVTDKVIKPRRGEIIFHAGVPVIYHALAFKRMQ